MITLSDPTYAAEAERQRREIKGRQRQLFHEYADLALKQGVLTNALDEAIRVEWREVRCFRALALQMPSEYGRRAARHDGLTRARILRRLLDVRGALRRVERDLARRQARREEAGG